MIFVLSRISTCTVEITQYALKGQKLLAPHALKGQKLLAQGIALGCFGRKSVAL